MDSEAGVVFIGVAGRSASGKTKIAQMLRDKFPHSPVPVINMDWYYKALSDPVLGPTHDWDSPDAFDVSAIVAAIKIWKSGGSQWTPRHDYTTYTRRENVQWIDSAPVMIFEGILAFHDPEIATLLDYKIFVDCKSSRALFRRIQRDQIERGYSYDEIAQRYFTYVEPAFDKWIAPQKNIASLIIPNSKDSHEPEGLDMIVAFVEQVQTRGRSRERNTFNCDRSKRFSSR